MFHWTFWLFSQCLLAAPSQPPSIKQEYLGSDNAKLVWTDIPQEKQTGFIVNYTLYYFTLNESDKVQGKNLTQIDSSREMYMYIYIEDI